MRVSDVSKDRMVVLLMLAMFVLTTVFDSYFSSSSELAAIRELQDFRAWAGPGYVLVGLLAIGVILVLAGGIARIFLWNRSRTMLLIGAVALIPTYIMYETYAHSNVTGLFGYIWALSLGWLIGKPLPKKSEATDNDA